MGLLWNITAEGITPTTPAQIDCFSSASFEQSDFHPFYKFNLCNDSFRVRNEYKEFKNFLRGHKATKTRNQDLSQVLAAGYLASVILLSLPPVSPSSDLSANIHYTTQCPSSI